MVVKVDTNLKIGIKALNRLSIVLNESTKGFVDKDVPINLELLNGIEKNEQIILDQSFFSLLSMVTKSHHLNYKHNTRYYYDPLNDSLIPVYYDGSSKILSSKLPLLNLLKNIIGIIMKCIKQCLQRITKFMIFQMP